ncbi:BAG family molecular chaperone regulator 1 [Galemys pyrenaicus]|uniref:BAG family molecular chaperone regulator 1 n=1 Tax=Galemys pyrenaicus TaxID=202257 RepID=A0A8J6DRX3_GALPY|nr:BAG family molecular chaperone regulator 1 [Galemys pyrenaicus]
MAERSGAQRPRGDRERLGPRRRAPRSGRELRQSEPQAQCGPPPSQRPSNKSAASGHARSTRSTPAGARRPRVKKKVRPRSARSEGVTRSEEVTGDEEKTRSEEVARTEEVAGSEEVTRREAVTQSETVIRSEEVTPNEEVAWSEEMAAAGISVTVTHSELGRLGGSVSGCEGQAASVSLATCAPEACVLVFVLASGKSAFLSPGNEKHDLHVTPQQGCSEPLVQDLAQVVEEVTGVPLSFQKLIFKGKSLKEMEQPLSAIGIQNGCRVMLIGKKNSAEEEIELKKLKDLEKSVEKIANQLEELNKELTGIQQGFLAKDLQAEALSKLNRRVKATIEHFMKILEEIDTLILPENFKDSRLKRKGLVKKIQAFLAECDTVEQNICQETERLQSTNLALAE